MKARVLLFMLVVFTILLSACFKAPYHMDDDRGYYRDRDHKEHHYKTPPKNHYP